MDLARESHAKNKAEIYPENVNSVISEALACDHALNSETPLLNSEPLVIDYSLNSEKPQTEEGAEYLLPLLRQALVKLAKEEYHSTVLDLDEFVRNFNSRTPDYKKSVGPVAVGNEARKLKMRGWRL
jgi:hypothetical protein